MIGRFRIGIGPSTECSVCTTNSVSALIEHLQDENKPLLRTFVREHGKIVQRTDPTLHDVPGFHGYYVLNANDSHWVHG